MTHPKLFSISLLLATSALLVATARADTVTGRVVDTAGVGIAGVTLGFSNGTPLNPVTGPDGTFTIIVAPRSYDISFIAASTAFAPFLLTNISIAGVTNLGTLVMQQGHVLSGLLLGPLGVPVVSANLDVTDQSTGRTLFTPRDGTDAFGAFSIVVPAGTHTVQIAPPVGTTLLPYEHTDVQVAAATNLGTINMPNGVVLTGTVVDATTSLPVFDVDLDADNAFTGTRLYTPSDNTSALGRFTVTVPQGLVHLAFDPPAGSTLIAQQVFNVGSGASRDVGTIALLRGTPLSGRVVRTGGAPFAGANIDVRTPRGASVYISHDNSASDGRFTVVVPPGSYRITAEVPSGSGLVGASSALLTVGTTAFAAPDLVLSNGVVLSGTLTAAGGGAEANAKFEVLDPTTGVALLVAGDRTDANGGFTMHVPVGTWRVRATTASGSLSRPADFGLIAISGPTTLNRQLAAAPITIQVSTFGLPHVPTAGGIVLLNLSIVSRSTTPLPASLAIVAVDITGAEYPLFPPFPLLFPVGFSAAAFATLWPTPPVPSAFAGESFRYEMRLVDPVTGDVFDSDSATFVAL